MTKIYWYCQICKCEPEAGTIGVNRRDEEYHTVCGTGLQLLGSTITRGEVAQQVAVNLLGGAAIAVVVWVALIGIFAIDAWVGGGAR